MTIIKTDKVLRPRAVNDHYPTPLPLCKAALSLLPDEPYQWFLDAGAGTGPWGIAARALYPQSYIVGVERAECNFPSDSKVYDEWHYANYQTWIPTVKFSTVIGNPPFSLAQQFVDRSLEILGDGGIVFFLLRLAFLESRKRYNWWRESPLKHVWILSNRPSFTGDGQTDDTAYALYLWEKGWKRQPVLDWIYWETDENAISFIKQLQ